MVRLSIKGIYGVVTPIISGPVTLRVWNQKYGRHTCFSLTKVRGRERWVVFTIRDNLPVCSLRCPLSSLFFPVSIPTGSLIDSEVPILRPSRLPTPEVREHVHRLQSLSLCKLYCRGVPLTRSVFTSIGPFFCLSVPTKSTLFVYDASLTLRVARDI